MCNREELRLLFFCCANLKIMLDLWVHIIYNKVTVKKDLTSQAGKSQKGEKMANGMTNEQFKSFIQLIIQIIKDSKDKDEAVKKIEALLK